MPESENVGGPICLLLSFTSSANSTHSDSGACVRVRVALAKQSWIVGLPTRPFSGHLSVRGPQASDSSLASERPERGSRGRVGPAANLKTWRVRQGRRVERSNLPGPRLGKGEEKTIVSANLTKVSEDRRRECNPALKKLADWPNSRPALARHVVSSAHMLGRSADPEPLAGRSGQPPTFGGLNAERPHPVRIGCQKSGAWF